MPTEIIIGAVKAFKEGGLITIYPKNGLIKEHFKYHENGKSIAYVMPEIISDLRKQIFSKSTEKKMYYFNGFGSWLGFTKIDIDNECKKNNFRRLELPKLSQAHPLKTNQRTKGLFLIHDSYLKEFTYKKEICVDRLYIVDNIDDAPMEFPSMSILFQPTKPIIIKQADLHDFHKKSDQQTQLNNSNRLGIKEKRLFLIKKFITFLETKSIKNEPFDKYFMPRPKSALLLALQKKYPDDFKITPGTFNDFWKNNKSELDEICKFKRGGSTQKEHLKKAKNFYINLF